MRKLLLLSLLVCAVPAASAQAATLSMEGGALVYTAEANEGLSLLLTTANDYDNGNKKVLSFYDTGRDSLTIAAGTPCYLSTGYDPQPYCDLNPTRPVRVEGSQAKDSLSIFSNDVPDSMPVTMNGNGGDDKIKDGYNSASNARVFNGGPGNDEVTGATGNETLDGGDGNDTVDGLGGDDVVRGGAGDDVVFGDHYNGPGADVIDGGPGNDQTDEWTIPGAATHPMPTVTQDGVANDGRPGEGDNVTGIERFTMHINATYTGGDADEFVEVLNVDEGSSNLSGGGGNDILKAYDTPDTVNGGPGDDQLEGGFGNDTVVGGPGKDTIMGDTGRSYCSWYGSCKVPFGNDTIEARDGEADQVDCGMGEDKATVDAIDTVTNCETVDKGGATGPSGPNAPADDSGPKDGPSKGTAISFANAKVKSLLGGKFAVKVPCGAACRVTVTAKLGAKKIAGGTQTLLGAGTANVKVKATAAGKRALKRKKSAKLSLTVTVTGADGKPARTTRSVSLR